MRMLIPWLCMACLAPADEVQLHRIDRDRGHQPAGWPNPPTKLLALAEKKLRLEFPRHAADWQPTVRINRITPARNIPLQAPEAEALADGWQWTWTPPATRGPARYEVRFEGEPVRIIRIESRDPAWLKDTLEMLGNHAEWEDIGLSAEERNALTAHGLRLGRSSAGAKGAAASLQMIPRQGDAPRRRIVWDEENPGLVVWRPGSATGDLEVRAPRWWISPESLATDHGLIRFLDLFSEPPLNP